MIINLFYQILAINRAESQKYITVKLTVPDAVEQRLNRFVCLLLCILWFSVFMGHIHNLHSVHYALHYAVTLNVG